MREMTTIGHWHACALLAACATLSQAQPDSDWLLDPHAFPARIESTSGGKVTVLTNGLIRRAIRTTPNAGTVAFDNLMSGQAELRSVRPEARVRLDGVAYDIGGLLGQPVHNYLLPEWVESMTASDAAFAFAGSRAGKTKGRFAWKPRTEWATSTPEWPPPGVSLDLDFKAPASGPAGVTVTVHYELYDGIPLLTKWITVTNGGDHAITVDSFTSEILAWVEPASLVEGKAEQFLPFPRSLQVETDYSFGGSMEAGVSGPAVEWNIDPLYESQVNYARATPCVLECGPKVGPGVKLAPGESLDSPRNFELLHDSTDRERRGLAQRRMYRTVAPWVCENPLIFHAASAAPASVRQAIDQAAAVGFELVIMTFGSGFDIESTDPAYHAQLKELVEYAHSKGVALGGYSLLASRSIDAATDVINPATGKPGGFAMFGNSPCLQSQWGREYFRRVRATIEAAGLDVLEHDGNYPGDVCASTSHPGHSGVADSQWYQWQEITSFYQWCRGRGIYLNVPDWYFIAGSNKSAMGYRETNWSLPREQQEIIERQNIYDGTWSKTPSMGWMFVPLMEYQGGGAAATIEPLDAHRDHYERRLNNLLGAGVQACYRGPRLFDTDATRKMVKARVAWFKRHRAILESDVVHGVRANGRDIDWLLHVSPGAPDAGMLVAYNPRPEEVQSNIKVNMYYTGLRGEAVLVGEDGVNSTVHVGTDGVAHVPVKIAGRGMAWYLVRKP